MTQALLSRSLGAVFAALALAVSVGAEEPIPAKAKAGATSQPYVVLVGISKYEDKNIKPRPHAEADAQALYDLFTNKDYLGVDKGRVRLLLGGDDAKRGAKKATRANILDALKWVSKEAGVNDLVVFAFVGQGGGLGESGDRRCYFAVDSTVKGRAKDAIAADEVGEALKPLKSQRFCTFLDVDFRGFTSPGGSTAVAAEPTLGQAPYKEFLGDDETEDHAPLPGRVAFLATNGLSTSLDLKDHGLFTQVLLDGLKGGADKDTKDGYESDGLVTVDELTRYVRKNLPALARKFGKTEREKNQAHFVLGGRAIHFVLTTNPDAHPAAQKRLAQLEKLIKDGKLKGKDVEDGRALLERMPRLKRRQELRKAYQQLADGALTLEKFEAKRDEVLASMVMKRKPAMEYSEKVLGATEVILKRYVKEMKRGQLVAYAVRELYDALEEKVPEKIEADLKKARTMGDLDLLDLLTRARQALGQREDLDDPKDLHLTLKVMLHKLDPYTTYIDPEMLDKFKGDVDGNFKGIGIQIRKDADSDHILVVSPIKDSPAYKAKLQAGDLITTIVREVDSEGNKLTPPKETPTKGLALPDAVKLIKGLEATKVKLRVQREGVAKPFDVEITRAVVETESVLGFKRVAGDEWDFLIDPKERIGYVRLTGFQVNSYRDLQAAMRQLTKQGVKGFVLDLRDNPGGLLDSAIKITDLFIEDGLIVSIRPRKGTLPGESKFYGRRAGSLPEFPMVCLVNGYSASGSEIVSAALQDHKRALVVGERSYGKGSVQNIVPFEGGRIKFTAATFWRPNGTNLHKGSTKGRDDEEWGVTPNKVIKLSAKEREDLAEYYRNLEIIDARPKTKKAELKDRQLDAALEYLRGQIKLAARGGAKKAG